MFVSNNKYLVFIVIRSRKIEHPDFQSNLRVKLFNNKQIRADFSMTFNNMLRTNAVKQLLEQHKIRLPARRK